MNCGGQALTVPNVPTGYKFSPYHHDLIVHYLKRKILDEPLPADVIPTTDVYASNPDKLPLDDFKVGVENEWFFFSTRSKDDDIILMEDSYYEIDYEGTGPITWNNIIVGYLKTLNFYQGKPPNGTETVWMVEEIRVNPEFVPINKDDRITQEKQTLLYAKFLKFNLNLIGEQVDAEEIKELKKICNLSKLVKGMRLSILSD